MSGGLATRPVIAPKDDEAVTGTTEKPILLASNDKTPVNLPSNITDWEEITDWEDVTEGERGTILPAVKATGEMIGDVAKGAWNVLRRPLSENIKSVGGAIQSTVTGIPEAAEGAYLAAKDVASEGGLSRLGESVTAGVQGVIPFAKTIRAKNLANKRASAAGKDGFTQAEFEKALQDIENFDKGAIEKSPLGATLVDVGASTLPTPGVAQVAKGAVKAGSGALEAGYQSVKRPAVAGASKGTELVRKGAATIAEETRPYVGAGYKEFREDLAKLEGRPDRAIKNVAQLGVQESEDILGAAKADIAEMRTAAKEQYKQGEVLRKGAKQEAGDKLTKVSRELDNRVSEKINEVGARFNKAVDKLTNPSEFDKDTYIALLNKRIDDVDVRDETTREHYKKLVRDSFEAAPENMTEGDALKAIYKIRSQTWDKFVPDPKVGARFLPESRSAQNFYSGLSDTLDELSPSTKAINAEFKPLYDAKARIRSGFAKGASPTAAKSLRPSKSKILSEAKDAGPEAEETFRKYVGSVEPELADEYLQNIKTTQSKAGVQPDTSTPTLVKQLPEQMQKAILAIEHAKASTKPGMNDAQIAKIFKDKLESAGMILGNTRDDIEALNLVSKHGDVVSALMNKKLAGESLDKAEENLVDKITKWGLAASPAVTAAAVVGGGLPATAVGTGIMAGRAIRAVNRDPLQTLYKLARNEQQAKQAVASLAKLPTDLAEIAKEVFTRPVGPKTGLLIEALSRGANPMVISKIIQSIDEENQQGGTP